MKLSIIVPVYRGGNILTGLTGKIRETLSGKYDFEVIFICDHCDNFSFHIVKQLTADDPEHLKAYFFRKNYGQHKALQYGFSRAEGDFFITMDEDLQHDPADILRLLDKQKEGDYDLVYGKFTNLQHRGIRNRISILLRKVLKHFIPTLYENYSPYRLIKKEVAVRTSTMVSPYTFIDDFLSFLTKNIAFTDITHHQRFTGTSSYTLLKLIKHGILILLAYSGIIVWILTFAGLVIILGSIMLLIKEFSYGDIIHNLISIRLIVGVFITGLVAVIISLSGAYISYRNNSRNTRFLSLSDSDTL